MNQHNNPTIGEIEKYLGIYKRELIGKALVERLHLPMPLIGGFFILLYFGVLLGLHNRVGDRLPNNFKEVFSHPSSDSYYYPDLIGVSYDLIGHPLLLVLLVFFRHYIPRQFSKLELDGLIQEKPRSNLLNKFTQFVTRDHRVQFFAIIVLPLIASSLHIVNYDGLTMAVKYANFLTLLSFYATSAITIQLVYIFLILDNYSINTKLNLAHPDQCCGLAPFGNLAIAIYMAFLTWAMLQAVAIPVGGIGWQKEITRYFGSAAIICWWSLFLLFALYIFDKLIYQPHRTLVALQRNHLEVSGQAWTDYHHNLHSSLVSAVTASQISLADQTQHKYSDDLKLLETWAILDKYVSEMHTWPISNSTLRRMAIIANPLLPIFTPFIKQFLVSMPS